MAGTTRKKKSTGRRTTKSGKNTSRNTKKNTKQQGVIADEVILLIVLAVSILLLLSNFGLGGFAGKYVSGLLFGVFGKIAYIIPFVLFIGFAFGVSNRGNVIARIKVISGILFVTMLCAFLQMATVNFHKDVTLYSIFAHCSTKKTAGGVVGGAVAKLLCPIVGTAGTYVIIIIMLIICLVIITEKSFFGGIKRGSSKVYQTARRDAEKRKEKAAVKRQQRSDKRASGVTFDTALPRSEAKKSDLHEIKAKKKTKKKAEPVIQPVEQAASHMAQTPLDDFVIKRSDEPFEEPLAKEELIPENDYEYAQMQEQNQASDFAPEKEEPKPRKTKKSKADVGKETMDVEQQILKNQSETGSKAKAGVEYNFPPMSLLKKSGKKAMGDSNEQLRETAAKLQQTLQNFGVNVTVTNVSCGPSVTRYELQPEQGVKVSRIVNLSDDIKLNLAAPDIRIEAPIPGKAAVGIEVPNVENSTVMLRDLLESRDFMEHSSNIAFAAGRDIGGKIVVADIMKMPHLLIAGSTGSGKSVCINTLIMSILYKASPDDVKLIMIDPKVVELSVYNGIPHLFIPVVTDPKKAAGALNWAVSEMTDRYKKFADLNVRDLKGYNEKIKTIEDIDEEGKPEKLPQIVIIVDELADLMMVAPGEVEDAICRLAQLARAAGIHLILATQRPSVNVITGLIKANMPSRIAFSVSSGVDSRTIIDMNGAEKLLGKGDMLFYPAGIQKPVRVQGAFVSDKEVAKVVEYLLKQNDTVVYNEDIEKEVAKVKTSDGGSGGSDERDVYFEEAAKFIIEKDKASIGMLQRMFKIGFNRAARVMDQLAEAGVVGPEEGTKPRKVLMSMEEFEQFIGDE